MCVVCSKLGIFWAWGGTHGHGPRRGAAEADVRLSLLIGALHQNSRQRSPKNAQHSRALRRLQVPAQPDNARTGAWAVMSPSSRCRFFLTPNVAPCTGDQYPGLPRSLPTILADT